MGFWSLSRSPAGNRCPLQSPLPPLGAQPDPVTQATVLLCVVNYLRRGSPSGSPRLEEHFVQTRWPRWQWGSEARLRTAPS